MPIKIAYLANNIFSLVSLAVFSNFPELSFIDCDKELRNRVDIGIIREKIGAYMKKMKGHLRIFAMLS